MGGSAAHDQIPAAPQRRQRARPQQRARRGRWPVLPSWRAALVVSTARSAPRTRRPAWPYFRRTGRARQDRVQVRGHAEHRGPPGPRRPTDRRPTAFTAIPFRGGARRTASGSATLSSRRRAMSSSLNGHVRPDSRHGLGRIERFGHGGHLMPRPAGGLTSGTSRCSRSRRSIWRQDAAPTRWDFWLTLTRSCSFRCARPAPARHRRRTCLPRLPRTFAGDSPARHTAVVVSEQEVASKITAATAGIATTFPENTAASTTPSRQRTKDISPVGRRQTRWRHQISPRLAPWDTLMGTLPRHAGLSPTLQQMILGGDPANLTGQGLRTTCNESSRTAARKRPQHSVVARSGCGSAGARRRYWHARTHCSTND